MRCIPGAPETETRDRQHGNGHAARPAAGAQRLPVRLGPRPARYVDTSADMARGTRVPDVGLRTLQEPA